MEHLAKKVTGKPKGAAVKEKRATVKSKPLIPKWCHKVIGDHDQGQGGSSGGGPGVQVKLLMDQMERTGFTPKISDSQVDHALTQVGFQGTSPQIGRVLSLVTEKFLRDVMTEALVNRKMKEQDQDNGPSQTQASKSKGNKVKKENSLDLNVQDLQPILQKEFGISVRKPPYYL